LVVTWLAIFAPMTCSYHGFLLHGGANVRIDATGMVRLVSSPETADMTTMPAGHGQMAANAQKASVPVTNHHTSDEATSLAFAVLVPAGIALPPLIEFQARWYAVDETPLYAPSPTVRPPRWI
jgi:hypothetical protein